jgi:RNA polymerase sigma-70 factor (ECF subfamily)
LEKLSPRDRLVITLLHLEERSVAEAAEHTGWSQTMVKVQAFRARARLKKLLQQRAEDVP